MARLFFSLLIFSLLLLITPFSAVAAGTPGNQIAASTLPWHPPEPAFKIFVNETGLYRLTYADLVVAGLPVKQIDPRTFQMFEAGEEIAIDVLGESDGSFDDTDSIIFFGQAANTRYTQENVYWLSFGRSNGLRMISRIGSNGGVARSTYTALARFEKNQIYVSTLPLGPGHDHWYGPGIQAAGLKNSADRTFPLSLDAVAEDGKATLEARFAGNVQGIHHLQLYVNGLSIADETWSGRILNDIHATVPQKILHDGVNDVKVVLLNDSQDQYFDMVYLDWLQIRYTRTLTIKDKPLVFENHQPGSWRYVINDSGSQQKAMYDITNPARVQRIISREDIAHLGIWRFVQRTLRLFFSPNAEMDTFHHLTFGDSIARSHRYLVVASSHLRSPEKIIKDAPSNLQDVTHGADYILITHHDFWDAAQKLADYRAMQGMRTAVVDVQDIYDEFNGGLMSAESIHAFLAYAYTHWSEPAPQYVLLLGDGTYDMRHYLPDTAPTFIPPYLMFIDTLLGEVATDNRYVTIVGDDNLPDMHIGRMPANTKEEADRMVSKTIAYESNPAPGNWNRNIIFVTDDLEGGGGDFYALADELADGYIGDDAPSSKLIPTTYHISKIYAGKTCDRSNPEFSNECKSQIVDNLENQGALILNYIGHATKDYWAAERLMDQATIDKLNNEGRWPITLAMSCVDGFFQQPRIGAQSFAEANVRAKGGSVASWSATSLGLSNPHQLLEKGFFLALFHDHIQTLGAATTAAKQYVFDKAPQKKHYLEAIDTYMLFGDPALRVNLFDAQQ